MNDAGYRLVSFRSGGGKPQAGILVGGRIHPTSSLGDGLDDAGSVLGLLRQWDKAHPLLASAAKKADPKGGLSTTDVTILAPILYPGALYCAGANYWDHLAEMAEVAKRMTGKAPSMEKAADPYFFMKNTAGGIIGPDTPARLPSFSKQVDWEAELGVVIGKPMPPCVGGQCFRCGRGYLIVNDLSARDLMKREGSAFGMDWIGQKCFEDAAPMGPWLTPAAYVQDPNNLAIKLWVNGVLKQELEHVEARARHCRADRLSEQAFHVVSGRRHRDRHACRGRHAARRIPQSRRRGEDRDRRLRHARQSHGRGRA